ncbi:MAG TPA: hypothetical protein VIY73_24635 [Polyangiaceae bacterium]
MSAESIVLLFDEIADHMVTARAVLGQTPRWQVTSAGVPRGYSVLVEIDGEVAVDVFGRELGEAHTRALHAFRAWVSQTRAEIENALVVSIAEARAERASGGSR